MARRPQPRYMGGQAVMEGVMMRGFRSWAVAVRTPEGGIEVQVHDAPRWAAVGITAIMLAFSYNIIATCVKASSVSSM